MAIRRKNPPRIESERRTWLNNLAAKFVQYAQQLGFNNAQILILNQIAATFGYYLDYQAAAQAFSQSVTNAKNKQWSDKDKSPVSEPPPVFAAPAQPADFFPTPGDERRLDILLDDIYNADAMTDAIGLDLGIYEDTPDPISPDTLVAEFTVADMGSYKLRISFGKQGQDGLQLMWRVKGATAWNIVNLTTAYDLQIPPDPDGNAVTVQLQAHLLKKNNPVGLLSDLKTAAAKA